MKMKNSLMIGMVVIAAVAVILLKGGKSASVSAGDTAAKAMPRLVDLGSGKCIPCKAMKPILEELAAQHAAQFTTVFIDVREQAEEAGKYGIKLIPTQIFFDAAGKEIFRHEGFMSKEDILATWKKFGIEVP